MSIQRINHFFCTLDSQTAQIPRNPLKKLVGQAPRSDGITLIVRFKVNFLSQISSIGKIFRKDLLRMLLVDTHD